MGNLWDQCVKSAGSWCGMRQDQLRSCPAQPGMLQPRASGCQAPGMDLSLAVPAGTGQPCPCPWLYPALEHCGSSRLAIFGCVTALCIILLLQAAKLLPWLSQHTSAAKADSCRDDAKGKSSGMDVEVTGMRGLCGATHQEQHLHKHKAWSTKGVAILMFGDLAKMKVSRKGKEICSSQHLQIPHSCCFPALSTFSVDQLPSALTCCCLLVSVRTQGNALEGHLDIFLAAERRLSNPLEFNNATKIMKNIILVAAQGWGCLLSLTL